MGGRHIIGRTTHHRRQDSTSQEEHMIGGAHSNGAVHFVGTCKQRESLGLNISSKGLTSFSQSHFLKALPSPKSTKV